jgi:adenylate cyclase
MERRLAAILAADVVGYAHLMEADERATLTALAICRKSIDAQIAGHFGRIFGSAGDSVIAEFASPVEAAHCAVAIQEDLANGDGGLPDGQRMQFRIGINLGDVANDGSNLLGNGVNIAARLEEIAEPGGICLSGTVQDHLAGTLDLVLGDDGEQRLKNISRPVHVWRWSPGTSDALAGDEGSSKPCIAVLPFDNMSGDPEQAYFSGGLTEDIITALAKHRWLDVVARNTTFAYKGQSPDIRKLAAELGADYVVEGSVRRAGQRIRVTAQLIDTATGSHIWAERYDRDLKDIFEVQDEITRHITTALSIELVYGTYSGNWIRGTESFEAWDALSKGIFEFMKFTRPGFQACLTEVERALVADPACGTAFAFKGWGLAMMARYFSSDPGPLWDQAREWCEKALALEASRPLGLGLLAFCEMNEGRLEQAVESLKEAISLAPTAENHFLLGQTYLYLGRAKDSIAQTQQAMRLSPRCPGYFLFNMIDGHRILGQFEESLLWADKCIEKMPNSPLPVVRKVSLLSLAERREEAEALAKQLLALEPNFSVDAWIKGQPFRNPEHIEPFAEALRQIGLPD